MKEKKIFDFSYRTFVKIWIIFIILAGYIAFNQISVYASAYPSDCKGYFTIYYIDADGTEYGYKIDVNFGASFMLHNIASQNEGGSNWGAENISYTVTTILGDDSKKPIIWFNYVGNDIPDQSGHFRNVTIQFLIPRTEGASYISYVKMENTRFGHNFVDESTSTDVANNMYRTGSTFPLQDLGIKVYGDSAANNSYDMSTASNIKIYLKTVYNVYNQQVNHYMYKPTDNSYYIDHTDYYNVRYGLNFTPPPIIPNGYCIMRSNFNTSIDDKVDLANGYTVYKSNVVDIVYEPLPQYYTVNHFLMNTDGLTYSIKESLSLSALVGSIGYHQEMNMVQIDILFLAVKQMEVF